LWLSYQLAIGKDFWKGFLLALGFTLLAIASTINQKTKSLSFEDGRLVQNSFFIHQSVHLPTLIRAERYVTTGKWPSPKLKLEDDRGGLLIFTPGDFTMTDLESIVALLHPYIFINRVEKNFMDLQFYIEQGLDIPSSSAWHIIRGTFLFLFLPCIVLTFLIVVWTILTK
jgi:hypothetical protein